MFRIRKRFYTKEKLLLFRYRLKNQDLFFGQSEVTRQPDSIVHICTREVLKDINFGVNVAHLSVTISLAFSAPPEHSSCHTHIRIPTPFFSVLPPSGSQEMKRRC